MDNGIYNIIYFDTRARANRVVKKTDREELHPDAATELKYEGLGELRLEEEVKSNIELLLSVFSEVSVSRSASHCILSLQRPEKTHALATIVFMHIPADGSDLHKERPRDTRTPSPRSKDGSPPVAQAEKLNGPQFLWQLETEANAQRISKPVILVVLLGGTLRASPVTSSDKLLASPMERPSSNDDELKNGVYTTSLLDAGAVDVLQSPLSKHRLQSILAQAYRESKRDRVKSSPSFEPLSRKTSWMGTPESKPFSYLRETMVSGLMYRICNPDHPEERIDPRALDVSTDRKVVINEAVGSWEFSAHDFTDDELLYGALLILRHTLRMPDLAKYQIHTVGQIPIASILTPFHGLMLLISTIGHDVGHPGVNNMFLVKLNAPLAQLYNDRSVLESFHCAAFSQILRRYWPAAFGDATMRRLMINSILATDMGLHTQYTTRLANLSEALSESSHSIDGWTPASIEENRDLLCCLLIKCADICNVARKFPIATQWARILTDEFSHQGAMEQELKMPTCLFGGPPVQNDLIKMGESQLSFMGIFAAPLFGSMAEVLPDMCFASETIEQNKQIWNETIDAAKEKRLSSIDTALAKHKQPIKSAPLKATETSPLSATKPPATSASVCAEPTAPSTASPASDATHFPVATLLSPDPLASDTQNPSSSLGYDLSPARSQHSTHSLDPHPGTSTQFLETNLSGSSPRATTPKPSSSHAQGSPSNASPAPQQIPTNVSNSAINGRLHSPSLAPDDERNRNAGSPVYEDLSAATQSHSISGAVPEQLASESGGAMAHPELMSPPSSQEQSLSREQSEARLGMRGGQVEKSASLADFGPTRKPRAEERSTEKDAKVKGTGTGTGSVRKGWRFWKRSQSVEQRELERDRDRDRTGAGGGMAHLEQARVDE
ncbi:MAG: 3',5'-cyclic-nucleotide phosphodiesterase [Chrysothrix sp. TS-e1954]|nr:MAG: 3',5'-cyclic-nucleotide phosphodiesterase [Chrysothrix sp. TS-e1954]